MAVKDNPLASVSDSPVKSVTVPTTSYTGEAGYNSILHLDDVYLALISASLEMEGRVKSSLEVYVENPDVQANLQQLQYDLQSWNLALTTMTNMQKNMADALKSIVSNLR